MDNETKERIHKLVEHGHLTAKFGLKPSADYFAKLLKSHGHNPQVWLVNGHSPTVDLANRVVQKHYHVSAERLVAYNVVHKFLGR